jgi:hypothetical protein
VNAEFEENAVTITLPFSFKGKIFEPSCRINLNELMEKGSFPCLYTHLANENRISVYSYEYDVMMMSDMEFSDATGMVAKFIREGHFDADAFEIKWKQAQLDFQLQQIANRYMEPSNLEQNHGLKQALMDAYQLGQGTAAVEKKNP